MSRKPKETAKAGDQPGPESFKLQVAKNLRRLRNERGWSLVELSRRADVSSAMLSQVETGKTTPTIAVLWKVASGFSVPFTELLRDDAPSGSVVVRHTGPRPSLTTADGTFRSTPLLPASSPEGVELYRIVIDGHGGSQSPAHTPGTTEVVVVERGTLRLIVGDSEHELGLGDVASFSADVEHGYHAGPEGAVIYDLVRYGPSALPHKELFQKERPEEPPAKAVRSSRRKAGS